VKALTSLLASVYWDVREASVVSLSKVGDRHSVRLLQNLPPDNSRLEACRKNALSYLQARTTQPQTSVSNARLFDLAREAFDTGDYGQARFLLERVLKTIAQDHLLYLDVLTLLAQSYAEMSDSGEAINLIKPVLSMLPAQSRQQVSKDLVSWLWDQLALEAYDPTNDENYLLVLNIHLDHALKSKNPDEVLGNLRYLTRWLEILGEGDMAQWIRSLIRSEAPGTWYVDRHNRNQYVREVKLSGNLRPQLLTISNRIKASVPNKLSQVLQSPNVLKDADYLLTD